MKQVTLRGVNHLFYNNFPHIIQVSLTFNDGEIQNKIITFVCLKCFPFYHLRFQDSGLRSSDKIVLMKHHVHLIFLP